MRKPSLSALRAFETTARLGSMRRAASELQVDHAVVSRHIRTLEADLGVELFQHHGNKLMVTEKGKAFALKLTIAFDTLQGAVNEVKGKRRADSLVISCVHGFAQRWLLPRLQSFRNLHPEIQIEVRSADENKKPGDNGVDVTITYLQGSDIPEGVDTLASPAVFPIISKQLLSKHGGEISDMAAMLRRVPLLHEAGDQQWARWLATALDTTVPTSNGFSYSNSSMAIEAAIHGQGIALANRFLVERELEAGSLVCLKPGKVVLGHYTVEAKQAPSPKPSLRAFQAWLIESARDFDVDGGD